MRATTQPLLSVNVFVSSETTTGLADVPDDAEAADAQHELSSKTDMKAKEAKRFRMLRIRRCAKRLVTF
jgi:hypothetical protein